jgi:arsenical pump membrane protein
VLPLPVRGARGDCGGGEAKRELVVVKSDKLLRVLVISIVAASVAQVWPPFVLVAGLLLIGQVAAAEGVFEAAGAQIARVPLSPRALLVALLGLVALVTAVLNLDTSVVFLTPVLLHAARRRRLDERPFLYGTVFMSNSASLLLPASNLTNLLVLRSDPITGAQFATRMLPAWLAACALTTTFMVVAFPLRAATGRVPGARPIPIGPGAIATLAAAGLVVILPNPALPVLVLGIGVVAHRRLRPRLDLRVLAALFTLAVALGTLARAWPEPVALISNLGGPATAAVAALAAILLNNLPASVLLSAQATPHPQALLLGLDLGPNLAVTGSLSAFLWIRAASAAGTRPSIRTYSTLGLALTPLTITGALALTTLAQRG